jgi:hypothetical protein
MQLMNAAQAIAEQQQRIQLQHQLINWTRAFEERLRAIEQGFGDLMEFRGSNLLHHIILSFLLGFMV